MLEETYASVIDVVFPDSPDSQNVLLAEETCTFYIERYTTGRGRVTLIDNLFVLILQGGPKVRRHGGISAISQ